MRSFVARDCFPHTTLLIAALMAASPSIFAQAPGSSTANQTPYNLKVTSNLVVVRVVVRDAQNKPVENLKKEDFKLFDRGKLQAISQFALEIPAAQPAGVTSAQPTVTALSVLPQRFLALYFDDLNMTDTAVVQVREAADRYLAANLQPGDRVGLFTSGNSLVDFTGDPKQIHDGLLKLHASPLVLRPHDCPEISDYQAQQILEFDDEKIDVGLAGAEDSFAIRVVATRRQRLENRELSSGQLGKRSFFTQRHGAPSMRRSVFLLS